MRTHAIGLLTLLVGLTGPGCAPAAGTEPHDMSVEGHEAAAGAEETAAEEHDAESAAEAEAAVQRCDAAGHSRPCWTSTMNPTTEHSAEAARHRELAARHRAASQALQSAEASACAGVSEDDRDISPFARTEDIRRVTELTEERRTGRQSRTVLAGATIEFRAVPGLTAEWLQGIVNCHLARNAALGHQGEGMEHCPLVPPNVSARVRSVGDGFAVDVRSDDPATADEILRRARALVSGD